MAKNLCDFVCNCPADNTAERVATTLLTKLRSEVMEKIKRAENVQQVRKSENKDTTI